MSRHYSTVSVDRVQRTDFAQVFAQRRRSRKYAFKKWFEKWRHFGSFYYEQISLADTKVWSGEYFCVGKRAVTIPTKRKWKINLPPYRIWHLLVVKWVSWNDRNLHAKSCTFLQINKIYDKKISAVMQSRVFRNNWNEIEVPEGAILGLGLPMWIEQKYFLNHRITLINLNEIKHEIN